MGEVFAGFVQGLITLAIVAVVVSSLFFAVLAWRYGYASGRNSWIEKSGYHTIYDDRVQIKTHDKLGREVTITVFSDESFDEQHNYGFLIRSNREPVDYKDIDSYKSQFRDIILNNPYEGIND
jgi:hypothetical protein